MLQAFGRLFGVNTCTSILLLVGLLAPSFSVFAAEPLLALNAKPTSLADNLSVGERAGKFHFLGMLTIPSVTINGLKLSQLSDIAWDEETELLYAISDKGALFHLRPIFHDGILVDIKLARAMPLREFKTDQPLRHKRADAEGLALVRSGSTGSGTTELLVSFERSPRVVRYRTDGFAIAERPLPPALANAKMYSDENRMLEGMCQDPRHGIFVMPERPVKNESPGYNRLFSLNGNSWRYPLPNDNRIVALACPGNGEVLVLESDFGVHFWRSKITLKRVRVPAADDTLDPQTLFTLDAGEGYQIDNFEGLAHHRGKRYFMVSDDNDLFLQRTLLLYFELIED